MLHHRAFKTDWGYAGVVASERGLVATFLPTATKDAVQKRIDAGCGESKENARLLPELVEAMRAYFTGKPARFDVPLDLTGVTEFRRRVMEACRQIPCGQTATYADLARAAGSPNAVRAVGSTMANNPLPLIVPCHRVVRSDGSLGGFSSPEGVRQKLRLLKLEGVPTDALRSNRPAAAGARFG